MGFAEDFVGRLQGLKSEDAFNPYSDECEKHDLNGAPEWRRENFRAVIESAEARGVEDMWVGLAPGPHGARRTGLALTDEPHLQTHLQRWGLKAENYPTKTKDTHSELTAGIVWSVLSPIKETVFLWNVFPLHPHNRGKPCSIRNYRSREREEGKVLLGELVAKLKPKRIITLGNDAYKDVCAVVQGLENRPAMYPTSHPAARVRGPKGQQFRNQIRKLYP